MTIQIDEKGKVYSDVVRTVAVRSTLQTTSHLIQGNIHVRLGERLKDELDGPQPFLAVTEAEVVETDGRVLLRTPFMAIRRTQIVWVMPTPGETQEVGS
jgi:hypothetical protein